MKHRNIKRVVRFFVLLGVVIVAGRFVQGCERHRIPDVDQSLSPAYPGGSPLMCRTIDPDDELERDIDVVYAMEYEGQLTARFGRIRALPGDVVGVDDEGRLTVNGERIGPIAIKGKPIGRVPEGTVYILAVNPQETNYPDSRKLGCIPRADVRARILARLGFGG